MKTRPEGGVESELKTGSRGGITYCTPVSLANLATPVWPFFRRNSTP